MPLHAILLYFHVQNTRAAALDICDRRWLYCQWNFDMADYTPLIYATKMMYDQSHVNLAIGRYLFYQSYGFERNHDQIT